MKRSDREGFFMELLLNQKQELKLLMTSQLRQSIELLQYSTTDLEQFIREQELENPLIELHDSPPSPQIERISSEWAIKPAGMPQEMIKAREENGRDQLIQIVNVTYKEKTTKDLLKYIIHNLNDFGYLEIDEQNCPYTDVDLSHGICLLQQIGPTGVGARTIEECLTLQCNERFPHHYLLKEAIKTCLPLIAEKKWKEMAKKLNCSVEEVAYINNCILSFNPKPCILKQDRTEFAQPDIIVIEERGGFAFFLNDRYLPSVTLNEQNLHIPTSNGVEKQYIKEQYKNYQWLVSSIEQRRQTIIKIMHVLLEKQPAFIRNGLSELLPLTLKEVAKEIGMHESTVSRATSNKYIQTPAGLFELKSLFSSKVESANGHHFSQEKVKALLKQFIGTENKKKPFSDQKIAEYFNTEYAIQIARRTISKYRDELNIPSASMRKQWI